jgi:hypothetical protein
VSQWHYAQLGSYLLKLFLDDCKDTQNLGTKFHYSWLLILIALIRWREPPCSHFCDWIVHCHATCYTSLGSSFDPKHRSGNTCTFARYFNEIQKSVMNTWRITPGVVLQYREIANFRATRHNMWIQAYMDPRKEWLQLRYCVTEEDIEISTRD